EVRYIDEEHIANLEKLFDLDKKWI
ncbi:MAG: hypothetical protein ACI89M_002320, partial [Chitinophagales bacterium]